MTKKNEKTTIHYGRPKDRSFEAYVEFMDAMINAIAPQAKRTLTEEQRRANWEEFWKKVDSKDEQEK